MKVSNAHPHNKKTGRLLAHRRKGERLTVGDKEPEKEQRLQEAGQRREEAKVTPNSSST